MIWAVRSRAGVCGLLRLSLVVFASRAAVGRSADLLQRSALPPTVCVSVSKRERDRQSRGRSPSSESENSKKQLLPLTELANGKRKMQRRMCRLCECEAI